MCVVRLHASRIAEAEEAIARLWQVLESQHIMTPQLKVMNRGIVEILLSFASSWDAKRVARFLEDSRMEGLAAD